MKNKNIFSNLNLHWNIIFLLFIFFNLFFFFNSKFDLIFSSFFFDFVQDKWSNSQALWVKFFYAYGGLFQLLVLYILWVFLIIRYFQKNKLQNLNKPLFIIGSIFISEILVSLIKLTLQRPRPHSIYFFGGRKLLC